METLEIEGLFKNIYKDKVCLVTGHTGFKGSWLSLWLSKMGADVIGLSLAPNTTPNHYNLLDYKHNSIISDIRDSNVLSDLIDKYKPEIVFHLAAQPLVLHSYNDPVETYDVNIMGTVNLLESVRKSNTVKVIINITTDKCYANKEWVWGYRENDKLGGHDPYSSSKSCSELITDSYRKSFFQDNKILVATARAGNVIGGGDWAENRLIPDIMRATSKKKNVHIRNPLSTRPWQHVLEPISGYLTLGWKLIEGVEEFSGSWNFGPSIENNISVKEVITQSKGYWDDIDINFRKDVSEFHESNLLMLDCSKAKNLLNWSPVWELDNTLDKTVSWYNLYYNENTINTCSDLADYIKLAKKRNIVWTV